MSINDCARALLKAGATDDVAILMTAIAGAESEHRLTAQGDHLDNYGEPWRTTYAPYSCNGYNAFGPFQVFLYWHRHALYKATQQTKPCAWAGALFDWQFSAKFALGIYRDSGPTAWSAYTQGTYRAWMDYARTAVRLARNQAREPVPPFEPNELNEAAADARRAADALQLMADWLRDTDP